MTHVPMCAWCGQAEIQTMNEYGTGFCGDACMQDYEFSINEQHQELDDDSVEPMFEEGYEEHDPFLTDAEADADVLRSAGWGTDEDYGYFGEQDYECADEGYDCE